MSQSESSAITTISTGSNGWIVQLPGRKFPGVVLQGDTLKSLYDTARAIGRASQPGSEVYELTKEILSILEPHLLRYQDVLSSEGLSLPYPTPIVPVGD